MRKFLKKGFTLIELMIVVAIIGILAAIAIPNFIKFQARSKQSEGKTNLKGIFTAEKSFLGEHDYYSAWGEIGWKAERGNRYAYTIGTLGDIEDRSLPVPPASTANVGYSSVSVDCYKISPSAVGTCVGTSPTFPIATQTSGVLAEGTTGTQVPPGFTLQCNTCSAAAIAAGTIDNDPQFDQWEIGMSETLLRAPDPATCVENQNGVSGTPINTYNDVSCP
ncbi:MAG: prepilin-type N-terminal cleavage/methylation domain-containing protein [Archangiaceae bacterium]|nr:prepilin-type N-terminal cleavage/methylation domain-containing protein [Archangiaceae bacterium]